MERQSQEQNQSTQPREAHYENLVFSGGGILGIAYMGMLEYLYKQEIMQGIKRVAGASAGAITACVTAFNLPFWETKKIGDSLDYSQIPMITDPEEPFYFPKGAKNKLDKVFGSVECTYRLISKYGWYSSQYFYEWIKTQIKKQFDITKKAPPYTFLDFTEPSLHKNNVEFKELYIVGTDISNKTSTVFSVEETPYMEVAEAVRISMSVPLLFESVKSTCDLKKRTSPRIYADGGIMYNYPITIFDENTPAPHTLGALFDSTYPPPHISNIIEFIINLVSCTSALQTEMVFNSPEDMSRSIKIYTGDIAPLDFNVKEGDETYNFLYRQGYKGAENYFKPLDFT